MKYHPFLDMEDSLGRTPLDYAIINANTEMI